MSRFIFLFIAPLLLLSCDILRDSPFEVEDCTPGEGYHQNHREIKVSLLLSHDSDRIKTEQAFSLNENNRSLKGDFSWEGRWLVFTPASPLEEGRDYHVTLGIDAQDTNGISLEQKFEASFTTRLPGGRLKITGTVPDHEGILYGGRTEFRLSFTEPVHLQSCIDYISFIPSTSGSWRLEDEGKTACFTPREPWLGGDLYGVKIDSSFPCVSGSTLGTEFQSAFTIGEDRENPVLLKVLAILPGEDEEEIPLENSGLSPRAEYSSWEKNTLLCLEFSEPVDLVTLRYLLSCEPSRALVSLFPQDPPSQTSSRAVFRFAEDPPWGSSFLFRLVPGVKDSAGNEGTEEYSFRIKTSGPLSKPPALIGIRLPLAPGNTETPELRSYEYMAEDTFDFLPIKGGEEQYPYTTGIPSWVELYFDTAPETEIDLFSLMDHFRVEATNQALVFSPRSVEDSCFTISRGVEEWDAYKRVEIQGFLTNTINSGVVTFRIRPGLRDTRGNTSSVDFRISLLK